MGIDLHPQITDLIHRSIEGDAAAQSEFLIAIGDVIKRAVARQLYRCGNRAPVRADVEDLQQEVFERLLRDNCRLLQSVKDAERINAWLVAVSQNHVLDSVRKAARRSAKSDALRGHYTHVAEERAAYDAGPERAARSTERNEALMRGLASLPDADRLAIKLFYLEELSYAEIAEITGEGLNTLASRLRRARAKLRNKICVDAEDLSS